MKFNKEQIKKIAQRTAQRGGFLEFSSDAAKVMSGQKSPEKTKNSSLKINDGQDR